MIGQQNISSIVVTYVFTVMPESRYSISSGIIIDSSIACCLVGSEIIFIIEFNKRRFRKLYMYGFNKSSFRSPTIIIFFVFPQTFSILRLSWLKILICSLWTIKYS